MPDKLGQLPAFFVPDIARRRADYFGHGVPFHIFGHINSYQRLFVIEHKLRQSFGQFGLAHARRPEKDERADRAGPRKPLPPATA